MGSRRSIWMAHPIPSLNSNSFVLCPNAIQHCIGIFIMWPGTYISGFLKNIDVNRSTHVTVSNCDLSDGDYGAFFDDSILGSLEMPN